jgi:hypothetical protein
MALEKIGGKLPSRGQRYFFDYDSMEEKFISLTDLRVLTDRLIASGGWVFAREGWILGMEHRQLYNGGSKMPTVVWEFQMSAR